MSRNQEHVLTFIAYFISLVRKSKGTAHIKKSAKLVLGGQSLSVKIEIPAPV